MSENLEIPGYELMERVHEGGVAIVWKARHKTLDRTVLLNVLTFEDTEEDRRQVGEILDRARKVASLRHQGVVHVLDIGEHGGLSYVVTELPRGVPLSSKLQGGTSLDDKTALTMVHRVARALDHAWEKAELFHGNIKPRNILVGTEGEITVAELGMTRKGFVPDPVSGDPVEVVLGTPNYMSPEQIRGSRELDFRTDIYSLGATLYHCVTGRVPFGESSGPEAMLRHIRESLPNPRDIKPGVSQGMALLVSSMMAKDPADRPKSWDQVCEEVRRAGSARIVIHKEGASTGIASSVARQSTGRATDGGTKQKGRVPGIVFDLAKWAAILAVWAWLAWDLFKMPLS